MAKEVLSWKRAVRENSGYLTLTNKLFPIKLDTYIKQLRIPVRIDHSFRKQPITVSALIRSPVPELIDH